LGLRWASVEFRFLRVAYHVPPPSEYPDDVTVYLVVNDFCSLGRAFVETDIAEANRETVIRNSLSGQYSNALRVVAFNTTEGWSRDIRGHRWRGARAGIRR
jgi:hypothetical protein